MVWQKTVRVQVRDATNGRGLPNTLIQIYKVDNAETNFTYTDSAGWATSQLAVEHLGDWLIRVAGYTEGKITVKETVDTYYCNLRPLGTSVTPPVVTVEDLIPTPDMGFDYLPVEPFEVTAEPTGTYPTITAPEDDGGLRDWAWDLYGSVLGTGLDIVDMTFPTIPGFVKDPVKDIVETIVTGEAQDGILPDLIPDLNPYDGGLFDIDIIIPDTKKEDEGGLSKPLLMILAGLFGGYLLKEVLQK